MSTASLQPWPESRSLDDLIMGDGLVFRAFIKASPRRHGQFQFCFRPLLPEQIAAAEQAVRTAAQTSRAAAVKVMAKVISEQLTWCSATGGPLSADQAGKLVDPVFNKTWFILLAEIGSDEGGDADSTTALDEFSATLKN